MTDRVRQCIMNGNEFENVVEFLKDHSQTKKILLKHEPFDVTYASQVFIAEAKVDTTASYYNEEQVFIQVLMTRFKAKVAGCFHQLLGTNVVLQVVDRLAAEAFE